MDFFSVDSDREASLPKKKKKDIKKKNKTPFLELVLVCVGRRAPCSANGA